MSANSQTGGSQFIATAKVPHAGAINCAPPVSLLSIFASFAKIGAVLIGGGYAMLPLLEDEIVRRKKWATSEEITDYFALAQLLPGVIAINTAMLVGNRLRGIWGNLAASLGVVSVPFVLIAAYAVRKKGGSA